MLFGNGCENALGFYVNEEKHINSINMKLIDLHRSTMYLAISTDEIELSHCFEKNRVTN